MADNCILPKMSYICNVIVIIIIITIIIITITITIIIILWAVWER